MTTLQIIIICAVTFAAIVSPVVVYTIRFIIMQHKIAAQFKSQCDAEYAEIWHRMDSQDNKKAEGDSKC